MTVMSPGSTSSRPDRRRRRGAALLESDRAEMLGEISSNERLLERDALLQELRDQFDETNWLPPAPIVIEGRAGVGKTALLRSAHSYAAEQGWRVLWASGSDVEAKSPFGVVRQLFGSVLGVSEESPRPRQSVEALLSDLVVGAEGSLSSAAVFDRLDGDLNQLQGTTGVLVSVDDANWADPQSSEWLYYLARRLEGRRIRVIITMPSRSTGLPIGTIERIVTTPSTRVISVGPLGYESVSLLISAHFADRAARTVRSCLPPRHRWQSSPALRAAQRVPPRRIPPVAAVGRADRHHRSAGGRPVGARPVGQPPFPRARFPRRGSRPG